LSIDEFERISTLIMPQIEHLSEVRENIPLVSIGYSGIGGEYQKEMEQKSCEKQELWLK